MRVSMKLFIGRSSDFRTRITTTGCSRGIDVSAEMPTRSLAGVVGKLLIHWAERAWYFGRKFGA
jgi:hypothetical protein